VEVETDLVTRNDTQRRLRVFVLSLAPDFSAADDVLQETFLVVTRKAAESEPGTNFFAWARRIATFKVLALARDRQRGPDGSFLLYYGSRYSQITTLSVGRNVMTPWGIDPKDATETLLWQQSWWLDAAKGTWSKRKERNP
jgi:DNA-directed RNA polymerase specialized sigma24 family protein